MRHRKTLSEIFNGLTTIKGTVSDLKVACGHENPLLSEQEGSATGAFAYGAAALVAGLSPAATISSISNAEIPMEYYTCVVSGSRITGKFSKVVFQNGDEVEFVCSEMNEAYAAVAARAEAQRLIWMQPYQVKGQLLYKKDSWKWCWLGTLAATATTSILLSLFSWSVRDKDPTGLVVSGSLAMFMVMMTISLSERNSFEPFSRDATRALSALGFSSPEWIDLSRMSSLQSSESSRKPELKRRRPPRGSIDSDPSTPGSSSPTSPSSAARASGRSWTGASPCYWRRCTSSPCSRPHAEVAGGDELNHAPSPREFTR